MAFLSSVRGIFGATGRSRIQSGPYSAAYTTTQNFSVPVSGEYDVWCIGGGGAGGSSYGSGGGSGYYTKSRVNLDATLTYTASIGAGAPSTPGGFNRTGGTGGTTSVGDALIGSFVTANGGTGGADGSLASPQGKGGDGGSGGGGAATDGNFGGGIGGWWGSNGTGSNRPAGLGQLGVAYGAGTNAEIPPGGHGAWPGTNAPAGSPNHRNYGGITANKYGAGLGPSGLGSTDHTARGSGGPGSSWQGAGIFGVGGMVVIQKVE